MNDSNATRTALPAAADGGATVSPAAGHEYPTIPAPGRDVLSEILHDGAQRLLGQAIEAEVADWIERHAGDTDEQGRQNVVRNGHHATRNLITGLGTVAVTQPRVQPKAKKMQHAIWMAPTRADRRPE